MERKKIKIYLKIGILAIFILIITLLTIRQSANIRNGPIINIASPPDGMTASSSVLDIIGKTKNVSYISMNDWPIYTDEEGNFNERILLFYGENIITFKAKDRFGKSIDKKLKVIYK